MNAHVRVFEDVVAVRERVPLLIGLTGPSGAGKTYSALRLAKGIRSVVGGEIFFIDTEANRAKHYADKFTFRHVPFSAPFSPSDYLAAIQHCITKGASVIVVDSMSHEHEGQGGILEMHEAEVQNMGGGEQNNFRAWTRPKAERRKLINALLQLNCNFIFCFRAKEKTKPGQDERGKKALINQGWMPIAGEEFIFEQTANLLLLPSSDGRPTWTSEHPGEKSMMKLPEQFRGVLDAKGVQLSEEVGAALALWAKGEPPRAPDEKTLAAARSAARAGADAFATWWKSANQIERDDASAIKDELATLRKASATQSPEPSKAQGDATPEEVEAPSLPSSGEASQYDEWFTQGVVDHEDGKDLMADPPDASPEEIRARRDGWNSAAAKAAGRN